MAELSRRSSFAYVSVMPNPSDKNYEKPTEQLDVGGEGTPPASGTHTQAAPYRAFRLIECGKELTPQDTAPILLVRPDMLTPTQLAALRRRQEEQLESMLKELPGLVIEKALDEEEPRLRPVRT